MANDPRLEPLIASNAAEGEIERLLLDVVTPLVRQILGRHFRTRGALPEHDADDVRATINLRLLHKLRRLPTSPGEDIQDLEKYVATLTYNVINDQLRRRFPERTRLKNRVRYVLTHDPRLALWSVPAGLAGGLKKWSGSHDVATSLQLDAGSATAKMLDRDHPADAVYALLARIGRAVELGTLVEVLAALWHVSDVALEAPEARDARDPVPLQLERREMLRALWREIEQLRPMQRKALLLNLRDDAAVNVVALLVLTGVAAFEDVAAVLEMTPEGLAEVWNELPLDDLRIADLLGVTRQQVINLRKSARERLARRLYR